MRVHDTTVEESLMKVGPQLPTIALTLATLTILASAACSSDTPTGPNYTTECGAVTAVHALPGNGSISVQMQNPQPDVSYILEIQDPATLNVVGQSGPDGNPVIFTGLPSGTFPAIWLVSGCGGTENSDQAQIPGPTSVTVP